MASRRIVVFKGLAMLATSCLVGLAAMGTVQAEEKKDSKPPPMDTVETTPIGVPIIWHGRIVNYVFIRLRLHLKRASDNDRVRSKEPFLRDLVVHAAHRTPFTLVDDVNHIDGPALCRAIFKDLNTLLGGDPLQSLEVYEQVAQHALPRPAAVSE